MANGNGGNGNLWRSALFAAVAAALQAAALALMSPETGWRTIAAAAALAAGVTLRAYLTPRPKERDAWREVEELRNLLSQAFEHQSARRRTHDEAKS